VAFGNAKRILRCTSGLSALKLLALTGQYSRPGLAPVLKLLLRPFDRDGAISIRYRVGARYLQALIRDGDQNSDLHSVLEVITREVYPLDPAFDADVVVDGGANIGLFTLQAAAVYPKATILMCEPLPRNVAQLKAHAALNGIAAEVFPVCMGGTHGVIPFYSRHANASSFDGSEAYESVLQIEVLRLGEILGDRPWQRLLLKLDIEGLEIDVLRDFVPGETRAVIVMGELHHHGTTRPMLEALCAEHGWALRFGDFSGRDVIFEARSPAAQALGLPERELY
jgi:FkbM family methyltransferase